MKKIVQIIEILVTSALVTLFFVYFWPSSQDISAPDFKITKYNYPFVKLHLKSSLEETKVNYDKLAAGVAKNQKEQDEIWKENEVFARYLKFKASVDSVKPKEEIVFVERIASSYIMNNPAFYKRRMSGSTIIESGKGAENGEICVVRLSDGKIIKANLKANSQWMGVRVGEKVRKVSGKRIVCSSRDTYWEIIQSMSVQDYTDYFPLY